MQARRRQPYLEIVALEKGTWTSYSACGIPYLVGGDVASVARPRGPHPAGVPRGAPHRRAPPARGGRDRRGQASGGRPRPPPPAHDPARLRPAPHRHRRPPHPARPPRHRRRPGPRRPDARRRQAAAGTGPDLGVPLGRRRGRRLHRAGDGGGLRALGRVRHRHRGQRPADGHARRRHGRSGCSSRCRASGIEVRLSSRVAAFEPGRVVLEDGGAVDADLVVLGLGVTPNSELAAAAGVSTGIRDALAVDRRQRTNLEGVYAAGDCCESWHLVSGRPVHIALGTVANKQGRVAGINLGGGYATFPGVVGTAITKVCSVEVARTGLTEREAAEANIGAEAVTIESTTHARLPARRRTDGGEARGRAGDRAAARRSDRRRRRRGQADRHRGHRPARCGCGSTRSSTSTSRTRRRSRACGIPIAVAARGLVDRV